MVRRCFCKTGLMVSLLDWTRVANSVREKNHLGNFNVVLYSLSLALVLAFHLRFSPSQKPPLTSRHRALPVVPSFSTFSTPSPCTAYEFTSLANLPRSAHLASTQLSVDQWERSSESVDQCVGRSSIPTTRHETTRFLIISSPSLRYTPRTTNKESERRLVRPTDASCAKFSLLSSSIAYLLIEYRFFFLFSSF